MIKYKSNICDMENNLIWNYLENNLIWNDTVNKFNVE